MRNVIFTLLLMVGFGLTVNAQTLASFEDGAGDLFALSDYGTSGDPYWYDSNLFVEGGTPQVAPNPSVGGINTSAKVLLAVNVPTADWWGNFAVIGGSEGIDITDANRYLHFQIYRQAQPCEFRIVGVTPSQDFIDLYTGKVANDGVWESVVVDLGNAFKDKQIQYFRLILSCNWNDPRAQSDATTYAFDNFALSDSPIPPDVTLVDGNGLFVGFEDTSELDRWIHEIDVLNPTSSQEIIDNPFTTSTVDAAGKVLQYNKGADASWWQGARFDFNGLMPVGGDNPQYLHVLVYVPGAILEGDMSGIDIQLCAKDHMGKENNQVFIVWDDEVDEWKDLVLEITNIAYLKEVTVRFDQRKEGDDYINSPAFTYYIDAIAFNNDEDPRTEISTGIQKPVSSSFARITHSSDAIKIAVDKEATVAVYDVLGRVVKSVHSIGAIELPVTKGIYIVNITAVSGEKQVTKVLVK
jgi:hypothetical protein